MSFKSPYRMLQGWRRSREAAMGFIPQPYFERILDTGPIAYWIQGEAAGLVAIDQINSPAQDGTYVGVTLGQPGIGDGNTSPLFDGINDYNDIWTPAFSAAFNGIEGSALIWVRVSAIGVWTDGASRYGVVLRGGPNDYVEVFKRPFNPDIRIRYRSGGVNKDFDQTFPAPGHNQNWLSFGVTWSAASGQCQGYYAGLPIGAPQAAGVWGAAGLVVGFTVVGAFRTIPQLVWDGYIAHVPVWDRPLTPAEMLSLGVL